MARTFDPARLALAVFGGLALALTVVWSVQPKIDLEPEPRVRRSSSSQQRPVVLAEDAAEDAATPEEAAPEDAALLSGIASLSQAATDNPRGFSDEVLGRQAGRPADARGVEQMMTFRALDVRGCLRRDGPRRKVGEARVMLRFTLREHPEEPGQAHVAQVEAMRDEDGRYVHFVACVADVTDHERFLLPTGGEASVIYAVPLIRE